MTLSVRGLLARVLPLALVTLGLSAVLVGTTAQQASACGGTPPTTSAAFARTLPRVQPGDSGRYVMALQIDLGTMRDPLRDTGYYGARTLAAVTAYQAQHGINPSGVVGTRTWTALIGSMPTYVVWPTAVDHLPSFSLRPGDTDRLEVETLTNLVWRAEYWNGNKLSKALRQRTYTGALVALVQDFQRRAGIKPSGIVGTQTWTALDEIVSATGHWGC